MTLLLARDDVEEDLAACPPDSYLTISKAAQELGVCTKTIIRWEKAGKIRCTRTKGNHRRIPVMEITRLRLLSRAGEKPAHPPEESHATPWPPPPRHEARTIKNQLKILKVLLAGCSTPRTAFLALHGLISLLVETVEASEATRVLRPACDALRAAFLDLGMTVELDPCQEETPEQSNCQPRVAKPPVAYTRARERALNVFWELVRAGNDDRRDEEEQQRARQLVDQIFTPYRRLTSYLASHPQGTLEHDVCRLLLTSHPADHGLARTRWSVRTLAKVCQEHLGTAAASKSQVGRFYKQLGWYKPVKRKLLSPDPLFGKKMAGLGAVMASLGPGDLLLYGDEFKFTSTKVQERVIPGHAPEGLQFRLKEGPDWYYGPACEISVTGLYNPRTKRLETEELTSSDFQGYLPALTSLIKKFLPDVTGKLYTVLDNGPIHRPGVLQDYLQETFDGRVTAVFLPTHSPNNNPVERVWEQLLNTVMRSCNTRKELRSALHIALEDQRRASQGHGPAPLKLHCPVCQHGFVFEETPDPTRAGQVEKHLCFSIPYLNPYTIQILTHSLEVIQLGHGDQV